MKDVKMTTAKGVCVSDPIPLSGSHDDRPSVRDLIEQHQESIVDLRNRLRDDPICTPLFVPSKHDDLWLLRFVLSHCHNNGKPPTKEMGFAVEAAKNTLLFRKQHGLDDHDLREFPPAKDCRHPKSDACRKYMSFADDNAIKYCVPDPERGVVVFLRMAGIDHHELVERLDESQWLPAYVYMNEWTHQWLDYITRTTGRLAKCVRIVDCSDLSMRQVNSANQKREAAVMTAMEDCYPQLLSGVYICQAPFWIQIPWRMFRPFLPTRLVSKVDFIAPKSYSSERQRLWHHIADVHLPPHLGGKNKLWPDGFAAIQHSRDVGSNSSMVGNAAVRRGIPVQSGWIWMKDTDAALVDAMPPKDDLDHRPAVWDLIEEHRQLLDEVMTEISMDALYEPSKHDDVFLLRFVLAFAKKTKDHPAVVKQVVDAVTYTLQFRKEQGLDEQDLRPYPPTRDCGHPKGESLRKYLQYCDDDAVNHCVPDPARGVISFLQVYGIHQHDLVKNLPASDWLPMYLYVTEWSFQCLDYTTRTTGRYTKAIRLANLDNISLTGINMESLRRDTEVMAVADQAYPEMLDGIFICQPPGWVQAPWRLVRPILPGGLKSEFDFVAPKHNEHERQRLLEHMSINDLPERFGGNKGEWPAIYPPPAKAS